MFENKKVLVIGAGKSGIASSALLKRHHAEVILYDGNEKLDLKAIRNASPLLSDLEICAGTFPKELESYGDLAVISPGVPTDLPFVDKLKQAGVEVIGEIELAWWCGKGQVIAITGTNGKTTTTTLVGDIMAAFYPDTKVVGNIGIPYTDVADDTTDETIITAEISSFQLETTVDFHPVVSAILNIQPDHLNRHHTMECYIKTKENITKMQTKEDVCVLNYDNRDTREFGKECPARVIYFSSASEIEEGFFYQDGGIYQAENGKKVRLMDTSDMMLVGMCNVENVMAAIAISSAMKVPMDVILKVIKGFHAVEHRIEYVAEKKGVVYYNDSKGTNPDAAIQGIKAMTRPTVLIGGGFDKGNEYDEWIQAFEGKVKKLVLIGETRDKIAQTARKYGVSQIQMAETFEEAFKIAVETATPGDAVLLSPACASWGMFDNYEQRGTIFKDYVKALEE